MFQGREEAVPATPRRSRSYKLNRSGALGPMAAGRPPPGEEPQSAAGRDVAVSPTA
ncbi:hypothetical protein HMPREF9413_2616 [Paenibacillus sp. HGF7]|nr:hypothetical protein HMPREF9413_2616 [Paenibacillus sp. HGF7]